MCGIFGLEQRGERRKGKTRSFRLGRFLSTTNIPNKMSTRRSRRSTTRVDYSKFAPDEDDEELKNAGIDDGDDSDEFQPKEEEVPSDDHMDLDVEEEEEEPDEEVDAEEVEEVVATPKKAMSRGPYKTKKPAAPRPKRAPPKELQKSRRNGSLVERMALILGANKMHLAEGINARDIWGNSMFIPQKSDMGKFMPIPEVESDTFSLDQQVLHKKSEGELEEYLLPPRSVTINGAVLESFKDKVGHEKDLFNEVILNAGGFVTSLSWAPGFDGFEQYLAVGVLDDHHRDPMNCEVNTLETSLFSREGFPSSIYVYKVNLDPKIEGKEDLCTLISSFSHDFGSAPVLKWQPVRIKNKNSIGLLAMINQDGYLRVLHVPKDEVLTRYKVESPLRCFETPGYKITCFCWRTETQLTVGTDNGSLAEFDISDTSEYSTEPSFMVSVAASHITTISSGFPNEPHLIFEFSSDGTACMFDVRNLRSRIYSLRMKGCSMVSSYIPWSSSFVSTDDIFTARAQPIRDFRVQGTINSLNAHSVAVTSIGVSYFHPFVITGSMDGVVKIGNGIRRLLVPKRPLSSSYLSAALWGLDFSMTEGAYKITNIYKPEKIGKGEAIELLQPYPPNVLVTSLEWSPNVDTAEWYAAGTASGLIRFHRLVDAQTSI